MNPERGVPRSLAALVLAAAQVVALAGCAAGSTPSPAPPSTRPASATPTSAASASPVPTTDATPVPSATPSPALTPWPTIDPTLAFGTEITCGDTTPSFPPAALNSPPGAEYGTDSSAVALRTFLRNPTINPPSTAGPGWRKVLKSGTDALFVASGSADEPWQYLHLATTGVGAVASGWYFQAGGACRPELALPPGFSRAELWLDPARLPGGAERSIRLLVAERACSSGATPEGRIQTPQLAYGADRVQVSLTIKTRPGGQDCQGVDPSPYTLVLSEALGNRWLYDASVVPPSLAEKPRVP